MSGQSIVKGDRYSSIVYRVLYFASPFFQAVLDGDWKETHPSLHSLSDSDDDDEISVEEAVLINSDRPALIDGEEIKICRSATSPRASFYTADFAFDGEDTAAEPDSNTEAKVDSSMHADPYMGSSSNMMINGREPITDAPETGERLERLATPPQLDDTAGSSDHSPTLQARQDSSTRGRKSRKHRPNLVAIIDLSEEDASTFQDFLCLVYPSE